MQNAIGSLPIECDTEGRERIRQPMVSVGNAEFTGRQEKRAESERGRGLRHFQ